MTNKNAVIEGQDKSLDKKYKLWRIRAFWGTWLEFGILPVDLFVARLCCIDGNSLE